MRQVSVTLQFRAVGDEIVTHITKSRPKTELGVVLDFFTELNGQEDDLAQIGDDTIWFSRKALPRGCENLFTTEHKLFLQSMSAILFPDNYWHSENVCIPWP